jgi:phosphonatase-like hydrolase
VTLRLAVFDMIGTTVRAGDEVPEAFMDAFREAGMSLPPEAVADVRGRSKAEAIRILVDAREPDPETAALRAAEVYASFRDTLRARYESCAAPEPGAEDALAELATAGVSVVLATGLDGDIAAAIVRGLGWTRVTLSGVVTADDVREGRPAPDPVFAAMRLCGVDDPADVLVAGDTEADLESAAAAGAGWSVGVLSGAHGRERLATRPHSILLDSIADLPAWLRRAGILPTEKS